MPLRLLLVTMEEMGMQVEEELVEVGELVGMMAMMVKLEQEEQVLDLTSRQMPYNTISCLMGKGGIIKGTWEEVVVVYWFAGCQKK